jgi:dGTPase
MLKYEKLSDQVSAQIKSDRENHVTQTAAFDEANVIRRDSSRDKANMIRTAFIRDIDKIMHCPYYNRYADKTQVFSFKKGLLFSKRYAIIPECQEEMPA